MSISNLVRFRTFLNFALLLLVWCNSAYAVDCPTTAERLATYPEWYFWFSIGFPLLLGLGSLWLIYRRNREAVIGVILLTAWVMGPTVFAYLKYLGIAQGG
jgi:hypothetical protein